MGWLTDKFYSSANYAYSWVDYLTPTKVKVIAKTAYEFSPFSHFRKGVASITHFPHAVSGEQTRDIIYRSLITNTKYFGNACLFKHAFSLANSAPYWPLRLAGIAATSVMMARCVIRSTIHNTAYTICLPRAISNDQAKKLLDEFSMSIAMNLWPGFKENFLAGSWILEDLDEEQHFALFSKKVRDLLEKFFLQPAITEDSFKTLVEPLKKIFSETITSAGSIFDAKKINKFSKELAQTIVSEISIPFSKEFIDRVIANRDDFDKILSKEVKTSKLELCEDKLIQKIEARRLQNKENLSASLVEIFVPKVANQYASELLEKSVDSRYHAQYYLPIKYVHPCECSKQKQIKAEISSNVYYVGNLFLTLVPDLLKFTGAINEQLYGYLYPVAFLFRLLNYGQSIDEYKVAADWQCIRHRYRKFNKYHCIGVAVIFILISAYLEKLGFDLTGLLEKMGSDFTGLLKKIGFDLTGVDTFCTQDAIENFVMHCVAASVLADNKPLPGHNEVGWDVFHHAREWTRDKIDKTSALFIPDFNDPVAREKCINRIKTILSSRAIKFLVRFIFEGNDFYPSKGSLLEGVYMLTDTLDQYEKEYLKKNNKNVSDEKKPTTNKSSDDNVDPILLVINYPSINLLLCLFRDDVVATLAKLKTGHEWSKSYSQSLLSLPIPNFISSVITMPLMVLRDDSFGGLIAKLDAQMMLRRYVPHGEKLDEVKVNFNPATSVASRSTVTLAEIKDDKTIVPLPVINQKHTSEAIVEAMSDNMFDAKALPEQPQQQARPVFRLPKLKEGYLNRASGAPPELTECLSQSPITSRGLFVFGLMSDTKKQVARELNDFKLSKRFNHS